MYSNIDTSMTGTLNTGTVSPVGFKPAGLYSYADQGIWSGNLRVRRTW